MQKVSLGSTLASLTSLVFFPVCMNLICCIDWMFHEPTRCKCDWNLCALRGTRRSQTNRRTREGRRTVIIGRSSELQREITQTVFLWAVGFPAGGWFQCWRLVFLLAINYPQSADFSVEIAFPADGGFLFLAGDFPAGGIFSCWRLVCQLALGFPAGDWFSCWRLVSMLAVVCDAAGGFFPASGLTSSWKLLVSCWRLVSLQAAVFVACGWLSCWRLGFLLAASCPAGGWFPCWLLAAGFPGGSWFSCQR